MGMTGQVAEIALSLADLFEPLLERLSTPEQLEHLFARYGWRVVLDETVFAAASEGMAARGALQEFLDVAGPLRHKLDGGASSLSVEDIASVARVLDAAIQAISRFTAATLGGLPPPLDDDAFWKDVGEHLLEDLLEEYLRIYRSGLYLVLHAGGVIRYEAAAPAGPFRRPYRRIVFDWAQLQALVEDPAGALKKTCRWGVPGQPLDHALLIDVLARVLRAVHLATSRRTPGLDVSPLPAGSPYRVHASADGLQTTIAAGVFARDRAIYEIGLQFLIAARADQPLPTGVIVSPIVRGAATGSIPIGALALKWQVSASAGEALGVAIFPDAVDVTGGDVTLGAMLELTDTASTPSYLFGTARTARLEVSNPSLRLSVEGASSDPEARLRLGVGGDATHPGARLVIPLDEADSFVKQSVQKNALDLSFSPEVIWSSRTGLTFNGQPNLAVDIPFETSVGGVRVHDLHFALAKAGTSTGDRPVLALEASTGLDVRLGPVLASVDRLGVRIGLDFASPTRNFGVVDLSFGLKPPSGVGIAVDAPAVSGGGYLFFDPDKGQYGGVVRLNVEGGLTLSAIGLITTRLPSGAPGFSFLVIITAEDFKPIPLGLGFTLTGIGGLLAVNRTCNEEFLRAGLKNGTLDDVLFPADPIGNAAHILRTFDSAFPSRAGSYLFGPVLQIRWGTPPVLTMDLAAVLELGNRTRLIVLGRVAAIMPTEKNDLLRLQMSAIGIIDFDQRSIALDAVLYDSRLVGKFPVTGSMALRVSWGNERVLALSIGGFHPAFKPPPAFPALERLAIVFSNSSDFRLRAEAYLAITANTLQFGARVELFARAGGFAIAGMLGYDVLIQFDPFAFLAGFQASVQLKYHSKNLFKVSVAGELSGPRPLHIRGKATFEIFWCDVSVRFDRTLVSGERPARLPPVNVTELLLTALDDSRNWGGQLSAADRATVTVRETAGGDIVFLHPLGTLSVKQTVVPLDQDIARFGNAVPTDAHRFTIGPVTMDRADVPFDRVRDFFAPAQFLELSDDEKLAAPSFDPMVAGITVGQQGTRFTADEQDILEDDAITYETILIDGEAPPTAPPSSVSAEFVDRYLPLGAATTAAPRQVGLAKYRLTGRRNTLNKAGWTIASREDGSAQPAPEVEAGAMVSYTASFQALATLRRTNQPRARELMLVRTTASQS
jgi:uncharacterized protein DUF6603